MQTKSRNSLVRDMFAYFDTFTGLVHFFASNLSSLSSNYEQKKVTGS